MTLISIDLKLNQSDWVKTNFCPSFDGDSAMIALCANYDCELSMNQPKRSKNKLTLIATAEGKERAEKALIRLGKESQTQFAASILMSRSTVSKFFNRKPIQLDSFKRICNELDLKWQEIAGISEIARQASISRNIDSSSSEDVESSSSIKRKVTVIDPQTETRKTVITLEGDLDDLSNLRILQLILQEYSGNTIEIQDIQPGSIKITLEGSPEDINKLMASIKSGKLKELEGFPIQDIVELEEEVDKKTDDKWQLVREIRDRETEKLEFSQIDLSDTDLSGANLRDANLRSADLSGANLRSADLRSANLRSADLSGANLNSTNLNHANLIGAGLSSADLSGANLISADLSGANLSGANLISADLSSADLISANLIDADLSGANLSGANLSSADLSGADLSGADLSSANLSGADLSGANLSSADLRRAYLRQSKINEKTKLNSKWLTVWEIVNQPQNNRDLSGYDLSHANLTYAELSNSRLVRANLENTDLSRSNLSQANLIGANLKNAILYSANLINADLSGANVKNARFVNNQGISESLKRDLTKRGAIFEDFPEEKSRVLTPV